MRNILPGLADRGLLPDALMRIGIRRLLRQRLQRESSNPGGRNELLKEMAAGPVALATEKANEQHYEVPAEFFELVLGGHLKYSSCYWPEGVDDLNSAERAMLELTCECAGLRDGIRVLELGCGWGPLSLWMADKYPGCRITAVSNSTGQKRFIDARAAGRRLTNLEVVTSDINDFRPSGRFDMVISVEMFEHVRNWAELMRRVHGWLADGGRFFMHVFCHRELMYPFDDRGPGDWMARHFFTGGLMPSYDLPLLVKGDFKGIGHWPVEGTHYQRTAAAWLARMDDNRQQIIELFQRVYPAGQGETWFNRWRIFFMACEELFGYNRGGEWLVGHYLFEK